MKNTKNKLINRNLWHWPLPYQNNKTIEFYLDEIAGINDFFDIKKRKTFFNLLSGSLSLEKELKEIVIWEYKTLSEFQLIELEKVFNEEVEKFSEIKKDHPDDYDVLEKKVILEWACILKQELYYLDLIFLKENVCPNKTIFSLCESLLKEDKCKLAYQIYKILLENFKKENFKEDFPFMDALNGFMFCSAKSGKMTSEKSKDFLFSKEKIKEFSKNESSMLTLWLYDYYSDYVGVHKINENRFERLTANSDAIKETTGYHVFCANFFLIKKHDIAGSVLFLLEKIKLREKINVFDKDVLINAARSMNKDHMLRYVNELIFLAQLLFFFNGKCFEKNIYELCDVVVEIYNENINGIKSSYSMSAALGALKVSLIYQKDFLYNELASFKYHVKSEDSHAYLLATLLDQDTDEGLSLVLERTLTSCATKGDMIPIMIDVIIGLIKVNGYTSNDNYNLFDICEMVKHIYKTVAKRKIFYDDKDLDLINYLIETFIKGVSVDSERKIFNFFSMEDDFIFNTD